MDATEGTYALEVLARPCLMTPERLRAYVIIVTRDILPPVAGIFLAVFWGVTNQLEPWMLPLIAGLCGVPLVAPRASE